MQQAEDTATGLTADQSKHRCPHSTKQLSEISNTERKKPQWNNSFASRLDLAAEVKQQTGLQLDSFWQVQKLASTASGKPTELQITHPRISKRTFPSTHAVVAFLQASQQHSKQLPGVLVPISEDVMQHLQYLDPSSPAVQPHTAIAAAVDATEDTTTQHDRAPPLQEQRTLRSTNTNNPAAAAVAQHQQRQQTRKRSQALIASAVQRAHNRCAEAAEGAAALLALAGIQQDQEKQPKFRSITALTQQQPLPPQQQPQPSKRRKLSTDTAAVAVAVGSPQQARPGSSKQQAVHHMPVLPDGRRPCDKAYAGLQQQVAAMIPGAVLDSDWVVFAASHTPPRLDTCIFHPSVSDGYFRSGRAAGVYLSELKKLMTRKFGKHVKVPGLLQQQQQAAPAAAAPAEASSDAAAVQALIRRALNGIGRSYTHKSAALQAALDGTSSSNDAVAAATAGAPKRVAPQPPTQQQQQQQQTKKPKVATQQQGSSSSKPSSSAGSHTNGAAAAAAAAAAECDGADHQLPDGRKPCAVTLAAVQALVAEKLPGVKLDSEWLMYAAQSEPPKMDTCIKHPSLPPGYFRSTRSFMMYLTALVPLIDKIGPHVAVPGLIHPKQQRRQPLLQENGRPDRAVTAAIQQALKAAAGGFVWRGRGSSVKQKQATKLRFRMIEREQQQKQKQIEQKQKQTEQKQQLSSKQQQEDSTDSGSGNASGSGSTRPRSAAGAAAGSGAGDAAINGYLLTGSGDGLNTIPAAIQRNYMIWRHPPIDREYDFPAAGAVLVLGMVFASAAAASQAHAGMAQHRDRVRLMQLKEKLGYRPHSYNRDDTEASAHQGLHCQGNFNSTRGAVEVANRFPGVKFNAIFCDYFRFPTGYASEVYKPQLFTQFVPELIRRGAAEPGVPIYIPNNPVLLKQLAAAGAFAGYAEVVAIPGECYPLYKATELAWEAGELVGGYSNATEARSLPEGSEFVVMRCFADAPAGGSR